MTTSLTPTTGNLLVAVVGFETNSANANTGTVVSVSDSLGNTWYATTPQAAQNNDAIQVWYAQSVTGGSSDTVTATQALPSGSTPSNSAIDISVTEYSGVAATNALDVASNQSAPTSTGTPYGLAMTTTASCDLVVAAFTNRWQYTAGSSGYVVRLNDGSLSALVEDNIGALAARGTSVSATATDSVNSNAWGVVQAAFRSSASSQPPSPTQAAITTSAQSLSTWRCSSAVTVQLQNASAQPVNTAASVNVALSGATALFFSDSACTYPITSATIYGGTSSASFYVMFPSTSNGTITATPSGFSTLNQTETLTLNNYTWIGGASCDGNFNTTACWQGGAVPNNRTAHFDGNCSVNCNATFNGNENATLWLHSTYAYTVNQGAYNDTGNNFQQDGGTYTLGSGTLTTSEFLLDGGTFNAGSSTLLVSDNFVYTGGTFNAGTGTVNMNAPGSRNFYAPNGITLNNLTASVSEGIELQNSITVNGNVSTTSSSNTYVWLNGYTVTLGGNWLNVNPSENTSGGTLMLTSGISHTISGTNTFGNLTMDDSANTAADTLTFQNGSTQTITGTLSLKGNATNDLKLRSDSTGTQWLINPQSTRAMANLDVEDSDNTNATMINVSSTGSVNSGDNTNWGFSYATPALVQSNSQLDASCTACASATLSATAAGDLIVVGLVNGTTTTASSVTDNAGTPNTYTKAKSKTDTGACELWYAVGAQSASQVTVNYGSSQSPAVYVYEFSGTATSSPRDKTASGSGSSTSLSAATTTTTIANEVVVSSAYGTHALTLGSFTGNTILGPSSNYDAAYQIESATGTYGATWTQATGNWAECTASFLSLLH